MVVNIFNSGESESFNGGGIWMIYNSIYYGYFFILVNLGNIYRVFVVSYIFF